MIVLVIIDLVFSSRSEALNLDFFLGMDLQIFLFFPQFFRFWSLRIPSESFFHYFKIFRLFYFKFFKIFQNFQIFSRFFKIFQNFQDFSNFSRFFKFSQFFKSFQILKIFKIFQDFFKIFLIIYNNFEIFLYLIFSELPHFSWRTKAGQLDFFSCPTFEIFEIFAVLNF